MLKAIIFKEWLKTRGAFLIGFLLFVSMSGFEILSMNRIATMKGVEHIWQIMLMKDNMFVSHLTYIPLVIGVGIALAQMVPEMVQKRFKLTLHLPYSQNKMVLAMLSVGLAEMLCLSIVAVAIITVYDSTILVHELVSRVVLTMLPWLLAGFASYFFTVAVCIEGCWRQRVALALVGVGTVSWFFAADAPEAYDGVLPLFAFGTMLCAMLVFRSVYRFKEGRQD